MDPLRFLQLSNDDQATIGQLERVYDRIIASKKVIVISGAGISCSGGLQDFRSSDGLFSKSTRIGGSKVPLKDLFDANRLRTTNAYSTWLKYMAQLREKAANATISRTHGFLWLLHCKHKLQRIYTQNIDGLEDRIGIPSVQYPHHKFIEGGHVKLHGSLTILRCPTCSSSRFFSKSYMTDFEAGTAPVCPSCQKKPKDSRFRQRVGYLRPDVILYNETHPQEEVIAEIMEYDLGQKPDMLIVMGTTLSIHTLRKYVENVSVTVHQQGGLAVWIDKDESSWRTTKICPETFDCFVLGDVHDWSERAAEYWREKNSGDWDGDGEVDPEVLSRHELVEQVDIASLEGLL